MRLCFVLSLALVIEVGQVLAQAPSPFDLIPRLDEAAQKIALGIVDTVSVDDGGLAVPTVNPFDIIRDGGRQPTVQRIDPIVAAGLERVPGTAVGAERSTFDTLLVFLLLLLLSVTYFLQGGALRRIFGSVLNQNALSRLLREQQRSSYYVWGFLGALIVSSFAYVSVRELRPGWLSTRWSALDGFILATLVLDARQARRVTGAAGGLPVGETRGALPDADLVLARYPGRGDVPAAGVGEFCAAAYLDGGGVVGAPDNRRRRGVEVGDGVRVGGGSGYRISRTLFIVPLRP